MDNSDSIDKTPARAVSEATEPEKPANDVKQLDHAALFLANADVQEPALSPAREKRLLRKIDCLLLPMVS